MAHDPINTGYARALFEMAQAEGVVARVEEELFRLRELLKANPELLQFLKDPNVKAEGKRTALGDLFQGRVHPLVLSTLISLQSVWGLPTIRCRRCTSHASRSARDA